MSIEKEYNIKVELKYDVNDEEINLKEQNNIKDSNKRKVKISELIGLSDNYYFKVIITGLAIFVAYLFYQLGYSFIYGYYFGGSINGIINPFDILISQIPFDIKYISFLGIIVFVFTVCIFLLMYNIVFKKGIFKIIYLFFYFALIYFIVVPFILLEIEIYNLPIKLIESSIIIFLFISIIKYNILRIPNSRSIILDFLTFAIYFLVFIMIDIKLAEKVYFINEKILPFCIFVFIVIEEHILDYIFSFPTNKKEKCFVIIIGILLIIALINIELFKYLILRLVILFIFYLFFNKIFNIFRDKNKDKHNKTENKSRNKSEHLIRNEILSILLNMKYVKRLKDLIKNNNDMELKNERNKKVFLIIPSAFLLMMCLIFFLVYYSIVSVIGNEVAKEVSINKLSEITYYNPNNNEPIIIKGVVVKQTGNIYYISTESRELNIISSSNVIIKPTKKDGS